MIDSVNYIIYISKLGRFKRVNIDTKKYSINNSICFAPSSVLWLPSIDNALCLSKQRESLSAK